MADAAWKALERKVAAVLGGQRIAASGNGAIKGDVQHPIYHIECKWGKQIPKIVLKWYEQLKSIPFYHLEFYHFEVPKTILNWYNKAKEQAGDKQPLLIMKPKGIHEEFVFWEFGYEGYAFTTLKAFAEQYNKIHGKERLNE